MKKQKQLISSGLLAMGDTDVDREVTLSYQDDGSWHLWSFNEKCTVLLQQMNVEIIEGKVAPYYKLTAEQGTDFMKRFNKAPRNLSDAERELKRHRLAEARQKKVQKSSNN